MNELSKDAAAARAMGLSYGQYKALSYEPAKLPAKASQQPCKHQEKQKHYTDPEAFKLWQEGKTDSQIAASFGVSRTIIQRWRDTLELPSTTKHKVNTKKYRLAKNEDGTYYVTTSAP